MYRKLSILVIAIALAGCEAEERKVSPVVVPIGHFNGCDVSYVDRGYAHLSFYIATCETAVATTGQSGGKNSRPVANIQNISGLTQEEKDLIERNRTAARQSALNKLTPEEQSVLGVK